MQTTLVSIHLWTLCFIVYEVVGTDHYTIVKQPLLNTSDSYIANVIFVSSSYLRNSSCDKKSLKIQKGWSESVNRRRTDKVMSKRKGTNNDLQNITLKTKDDRVMRGLITMRGDVGG
jgi:hypothetical protein